MAGPPFHREPTFGQTPQLFFDARDAILLRMNHSIQRTKVYSGKAYLRYQELRKTMKNTNFRRAFFLVLWTWESQITSYNAESYSYSRLMIPLRNEISAAPAGFEMRKCGHQLQKRPKMTIF